MQFSDRKFYEGIYKGSGNVLDFSSSIVAVRIRYQVLDESTMPRHPAELSITIGDPSGTLLHTWNLGYLQQTARDLSTYTLCT